MFSRQEQTRDGYSLGVFPWIDVTAEGEEDASLPEQDDYRESILRFLRSSTTAATATTAASMETRVRAVIANKAHVFPKFCVDSREEEPEIPGL